LLDEEADASRVNFARASRVERGNLRLPPLRSVGAGRDPRLPPVGTVVRRIHGTTEYSVTILDDGFEFRGETYRSLSKIATVITGTPWNGYLFFFGRAKGTKAPLPGRDIR
jgi:hypothetical protein